MFLNQENLQEKLQKLKRINNFSVYQYTDQLIRCFHNFQFVFELDNGSYCEIGSIILLNFYICILYNIIMINDNYILQNCFKKNGNINPNQLTEQVQNYLRNRYDDIPDNLYTYKEVLYRIKHNITHRECCKVCKKPVKFYGYHGIVYQKYCSKECQYIDQKEQSRLMWKQFSESDKNNIKEKSKRTCLEKYGCEYSFQSENNKSKSRKTCMEKYGYRYMV